MRELTYGSLFAGVGGFDLGFDAAGFRPLWQVEIDPVCQTVLRAHYPDVAKHLDVRDVGAHNLAPVDVILFGSPCQDLSVAGKRAGFDGERSCLFHEAIRIIRELRPVCAVWENVPGALSSNQGRDFAAALDALADSGALDITWRVLDAQHFGVPQRRRRVFVVADFRATRSGQILFEPACGDRNLDTGGATGEEAADGTSAGAGIGGIPAAGGVTRPRPLNGYDGTAGADDCVIPSVSSKWYKGSGGPSGDEAQNLVVASAVDFYNAAETGGQTGTVAGGDGSRGFTGSIPGVLAFNERGITSPLNRTTAEPGDPCPTLDSRPEMTIASALRTGDSPRADGSDTLIPSGAVVRRLTPRECERLQGWPDDHTRFTEDGSEISDSHRYRMIGNGVASPVAAWIAHRMAAALRGEMQGFSQDSSRSA